MPAFNAIKFPENQVFPARAWPTLSGNQMRLPANNRERVFWTLNTLLLVAFLLELAAPWSVAWLDTAALTLAALAALVAMNRQLPLQNVLTVAFITAAVGVAVHGFSARTAIPLGPIAFDFPMSQAASFLNRKTEITLNPVIYDNYGKSLIFYTVPWLIPALWVMAIFTARGVGRLILRPWRKVKTYGYWLIALTAVLTVAFDLALEPYAVEFKHLWHWQHTRLEISWHGATPINFMGWGCAALLVLMFATPSLIRKQPGSLGGSDYYPLWVWLGALTVFAAGSFSAGLWWSVALDAVIAGVTTCLAVRGAKW